MADNYSSTSSPHERPRSLSPSEMDENHSNGMVLDSRPDSPPPEGREDELIAGEDTVTCLWDNCGGVFNHLPTLIDHIHNEHIGVHKSNYTCEWTTCHRRGLSQTSRFALISHIRSHTGEKPFICPLPECDKSFTRSDALAKHMRLQHNIEPPAPGRGGSRKRKREKVDPASFPFFQTATPPPAVPQAPLKEPDEADADYEGFISQPQNGHSHHQEDEDAIPPSLMVHYDPATNTILGRSKEMILYIITKAKLRYAIEQQNGLLDDLRAATSDLRREQEDKERLVDRFLAESFGEAADPYILPIQPPPESPLEPQQQPQYPTTISMNGNSH